MRAKSFACQAGMACAITARSLRAKPRWQLVDQPASGAGFVGHERGVDGSLQTLGIREPAHRQGRRGQPEGVQQTPGRAGRCLSCAHACPLRVGAVSVPVVIGVRVSVVIVVRMGVRVSVPMVGAAVASRVGSALGSKDSRTLDHGQVHGAQHVGQHMVGLDLQVVRLQFDRHVPLPGGRRRA